jgi:tetratricopeptide (TPR) repeat protein
MTVVPRMARYAFLALLISLSTALLWSTARVAAASLPQAATEDDRQQARQFLNKGVEAYKNAQFDASVADFKRAKELDPDLINARLYLATAYASQYIPGAPSEENRRNGELAVQEFQELLDRDPDNLSAIDGIGSILYNISGSPFDVDKLNESRSYQERHIQLKPEDPEPYYWVGVIDWSIAYRANQSLRDGYNQTVTTGLAPAEALPRALAAKFNEEYGAIVLEGIEYQKKAMELKPGYDDAMAYLNLLYRLKADMEISPSERENDLHTADVLVDQVKSIKQSKAVPRQ